MYEGAISNHCPEKNFPNKAGYFLGGGIGVGCP